MTPSVHYNYHYRHRYTCVSRTDATALLFVANMVCLKQQVLAYHYYCVILSTLVLALIESDLQHTMTCILHIATTIAAFEQYILLNSRASLREGYTAAQR
jgi:hypothetical protein